MKPCLECGYPVNLGDALTRKQKRVLDFIVRFLEENGYAPTYPEMMAALSLTSLGTIHKYLGVLERKGYIVKGGKYAQRGTRLV